MKPLTRIALLYPFDLRTHAQILARTEAQASYYQNSGVAVRVYSFDRGATGQLPANHHLIRSSGPSQMRMVFDALELRRAVGHFQPDLAVLRHGLSTPAIAKLAGEVPLVLEIHTDDSFERPRGGIRGFAALMSNVVSRRRLLNEAKGAVFVSSELSSLERYAMIRNKVVVTNGIDVPSAVLAAPTNSRPVVGYSVGYDAPWQGLDRFASLARQLPDFDFHLIASNTSISAPAPVSENVKEIRPRDQADYKRALASLDVSLGTLALDRKGLTTSASLKVRESVALGIPTFLVSLDEDLIETNDPAIAVSPSVAGDSAAFAKELFDFVHRNRGARVSQFTRDRVDITTKAQDYLDFLNSVHRLSHTGRRQSGD